MGLDRPLRSARVLPPRRRIPAAADQRLFDGSQDRLTDASALPGPSPLYHPDNKKITRPNGQVIF